ncbi:hypothetical protein VB620_12900 [Nodularia harveyana UHCC-0300]|uniref:Carboxypeptidase regulatory-like domain-containing protein n=1 Tax=Nodularia harveyana UHCC-0300 TaxID=2974287 RepID=A0ABU5UFC5_9CYAN|nr:hypothetical protein [Nodularia harveyana]MEA5582236.1 hypothetical protein [Nodularia harveyana UHCC-0300]
MQLLNNLPNWAKALFVFIAIVAGIAGYESLQKTSQTATDSSNQVSTSSDLQNISLTVLTRDSQPIPNVEVKIISDGPPDSKMTDRNGYTEVQIPTRRTAQITLIRQGFKTARETINLTTDPNTTRILYLDADNSQN